MKRVLVTGGSRGLGLAICERLLRDDWQVVTTSRHLTPALKRLGEAHPGRFEYYAADLSSPEDREHLCRSARVLHGLDGFVANAAIGTEGLLTLLSESAIREGIEVNLLATVLLTRQVVKGMLSRGGSLVFISSVAARTGFSGLSVYAATKGALGSFSRAVAREYGGRGIRANCILPGFLETEMSATLSASNKERIRRRTALRRLGTVDEVVGAVRFLLSEEARYITGSELTIDGGLAS
jgi:3-oxoacyl-[acyl-carrier protein] reductase